MDAIILAGGLGSRLQSSVPTLPKALAPILGRPFLTILLNKLKKEGIVSRVILSLGYKAEAFISFLKEQKFDLPVLSSIETSLLGTGGGMLLAMSKSRGDRVIVMNGDSFFDISLKAFFDFHSSHSADISIACKEVDNTGRYGEVEIDPFCRIRSFKEKSPLSKKGWINGGLYIIEKKALDPFPLKELSLEREIFPALLEKKIYAYQQKGAFIDIGTKESYHKAQKVLQPWV